MNIAIIIYSIMVMENISILASIISGILLFFTPLVFMVEDDRNKFKPYFKPLGLILLVCIVLVITLPGRNTAYAMLAAYGGESILKSETVQRLAPKSIELLERYIDDELDRQKESAQK